MTFQVPEVTAIAMLFGKRQKLVTGRDDNPRRTTNLMTKLNAEGQAWLGISHQAQGALPWSSGA